MNGAIVRIVLRYGVGAIAGWAVGDQLSNDPDIVMVATVGATAVVGTAVETWYVFAKKMGWAV